MADRPRVVHLTADFPDPVEPAKTEAIRRLVELTDDSFDHWVVSLNRRSPGIARWVRGGGLELSEQPFERGIAVVYGAPPGAIRHRATLERLGEWLAARIAASGAPPALLVGHKLTIEGVAVAAAAQRLGVPYALSIQGNTDEKIVRLRPDLAPLFRDVLRGAQTIFPFAPWAIEAVERRLGALDRVPRLLPCATAADVVLAPRPGGNGFVTVFHLRNWRTKGFDKLLAAHRRLRAKGGILPLAVIGGGEEAAADRCRTLAKGTEGVTLEGPLPQARMPARLNAATALVMPSRRESFGLVFIEALFAGCPVIYPAGAAVDGYFHGAPFALRVDPHSPRAISEAMAYAARHEAGLKHELAAWQRSEGAQRFSRPAIARQFAEGLAEAIAAPMR